MRHWIKPWLDWLMNDIVIPRRLAAQSQPIYYRSEKAGLLLDQQPVPWCADAVIVEAIVRFQRKIGERSDYALRFPDGKYITADILRAEEAEKRHRLIFRFDVPATTVTAEITFKNRPFGSITIDVVNQAEFIQDLRLNLPTAFVTLQRRSVACQTFIANQQQGLAANGIVRSRYGLAPLLDLGLSVQFHHLGTSEHVQQIVPLTVTQLAGREAIVGAMPPKLPKKAGEWLIRWHCGTKLLAESRLNTVTAKTFETNLRLCGSRLTLVDDHGRFRLGNDLPNEGIRRVGPCFLLANKLPGVAGLVPADVHLRVTGAEKPILLFSEDLLITDGPTTFAPGMLDASEVKHATGFELRIRNKVVAVLPLKAIPTAHLTAEGGFIATPEFQWTDAAENELTERLERLLNEP